MAETSRSAEDRAIDALTAILEQAIAPDMLEAQQIILRRLALSGDLFPSRIPPPQNITQIGGYLNLIKDNPVLQAQVLASALGVAGPNPSPGFVPDLPQLFYVTRPNDRPAGSAQPSTPVQLTVRSDLAPAFLAAREVLHRQGASLPVMDLHRPLPPVSLDVAAPTDLLPYLGRTLRLVPGAALVDPTADPLAVGQEGSGPQRVLARQTDPSAPDAGGVSSTDWELWSCDDAQCTQQTVTGAFIEVEPVLAAGGWHRAGDLQAPTTRSDDGAWHTFTNVTGLVAGSTSAGEELRLLHPVGVLAASSIRERLDWVWDGHAFAPPV
ncbi:hypothetical protein [Actinotalea sp. K2]|uniref:hypothetical protein n=1 Tax=Actinotalea sp. K2 TaxID=2939438 RepID=UPI002016CD4D|nr:hypothetical protein [Actinotalea sp. K2]MCL3862268.1 hypothetical protein [Actinotalea sp. K2]